MATTDIEQLLRDMDRIKRDYHLKEGHTSPLHTLESFVLEHGRLHTGVALPENVRRGYPKMCFYNSWRLASKRKDLIYCEGFAHRYMPVIHAWCVPASGEALAIDPTLGHDPDVTYFGVPFSTIFVRKFLRGKKNPSLLDSWEANWPLLRGEYSPDQFQPRWDEIRSNLRALTK